MAVTIEQGSQTSWKFQLVIPLGFPLGFPFGFPFGFPWFSQISWPLCHATFHAKWPADSLLPTARAE